MIKVLDQNTINKIAAGEVIEKPSSVIKELVENSIDSGATAITVEVKGSGLSFLRVTDNGSGIKKDEVKLAFLRHATSKLVTVEDLLSISSLGFRGEALASIASVAQVEMITKTADDVTGLRYQIHGGREISSEEIGAPGGTTIIVRNLFYNTPARKKFMKTDLTEISYIYDLMCRICMSHPKISFKFISNGTDKLFTSGNGKLRDIIYHIYGRDITSNLLEINAENDYMKISGYIARPCISRGNRSFEGYYVNHRYIKSAVLTKAIEDAFRTFVMIHKFPFTEINFQVRPDLLDVNVHPTKMELKFANSQDIYSFTYNAIRETLLFKELIPDVAPGKDSKPETYKQRNVGDAPEAFENKRREALVGPVAQAKAAPTHMVTDNSLVKSENAPVLDQRQMKPERASTSESQARPEGTSTALQQPLKPDNIPAPVRPIIDVIDETKDTNTSAEKKSDNNTYEQPQKSGYSYSGRHQEIPGSKVAESKASYMAVDDRKYVQQNMFQEKFLTKEARAKHRLIGQLFKTYWLIEYDGKFFIMDQHAAHEKVKYEELMENYKNKKIYSQYLMPPAVVTLSATEIEFLHENMETFEALGYQIENFGGREFKLNAVPDNLFGLDGRELFIDFIADASSSAKKVTIDVFIHKLSTMACKAAIKGNTEISFKEADALIDQLLKLENPYTCPHGRPTVISMTEAEIEKKFKRIV
ncbi:DNA mismatch repair endonuclease MutL [Coprococcus eutactus]|jgi:DNA mismatch repair protein MutL|uniref:DNA mismatch repair endonuclease MutL n=1 Tax=Coprococcus eutactus TaxID=33043 RepID=UPI00015EA3A1|nr:DNA mismatch repair endonuclease MutL [Coprococcus eutactus]EDP27533.1 DNA mismatch repair domain protein [Coprococcus eutactus ATCC 27759]UEA79859.1 DNA mismatch repair endonuclease MutL [Coprococcus eutactus ATCC 27759]UWP18262.1 DNA mismatch repair endonuclease MutL [Coprococcus eutactus]